MKKVSIIIGIIFLLTGCTNIKNMSYEDTLKHFAYEKGTPKINRTGYKYFLPKGMQVKDSTLYNEIIEDARFSYYLYVDAISYYNKIEKAHKFNDKALYKENISYDEKSGYLEINLVKNDKYLVEIVYNYAKIEVIVDKDNINQAIISAINILKSIEYNDSIIANLLGEDILNFSEEELNLFDYKNKDSDYITVDDDYQTTQEDDIPDTDLIN